MSSLAMQSYAQVGAFPHTYHIDDGALCLTHESQDLTSSTRWSKTVTMFEDDERFKAVEKEADREDLFRNYLVDLQKKERAKAQEKHHRNRLEYRQYLETCGFIKVDSQWRKVQDLLEDDERCSLLDKIDRLEIYQEYIRDLKKEEEQSKVEKEQLRRAERKSRDAFRKLMEEHVAAGFLTAKTHWHDYCQKVKDTAAYQGVAQNTSGSTPMDLFEDVFEELEKQEKNPRFCESGDFDDDEDEDCKQRS